MAMSEYRDTVCIIAEKRGTKQAVLAWVDNPDPQEQIGDAFSRAVSAAYSEKKGTLTDADKQAIGIFTNTLINVIVQGKTIAQTRQQVFGDNWWCLTSDECIAYLFCPTPKTLFNSELARASGTMEPAARQILNAVWADICKGGLELNVDKNGGKTPQQLYDEAEALYKQQDYAAAVPLYRQAAEQGHAGAQYQLGFQYQMGICLPRDYGKAAEWFLKAAEQGAADAQLFLGLCYEKGRGVPQDYGKAVEWFLKAAEQGAAVSQYNLGLCYKNGWGLPQDREKAKEWFRKGAAGGSEDAKKAIAEMDG
jgi:tetratricopeptide (TPR) repeat protein